MLSIFSGPGLQAEKNINDDNIINTDIFIFEKLFCKDIKLHKAAFRKQVL